MATNDLRDEIRLALLRDKEIGKWYKEIASVPSLDKIAVIAATIVQRHVDAERQRAIWILKDHIRWTRIVDVLNELEQIVSEIGGANEAQK